MIETESFLIEKNQHTVFTACINCGFWGVNFPLERACGNCGSLDTITYYDHKTINKYLKPK
jgi:uncharacterized OB-fold protein